MSNRSNNTNNTGSQLTASSAPMDALENIPANIQQLHQRCISAVLASTDAQGHAHASYAPYAYIEGQYYVFISGLAAHTANILARPNVGLLIIEDESSARNLYARSRLNYQTIATPIKRESDECTQALSQLRERAGNTMMYSPSWVTLSWCA